MWSETGQNEVGPGDRRNRTLNSHEARGMDLEHGKEIKQGPVAKTGLEGGRLKFQLRLSSSNREIISYLSKKIGVIGLL